MILTIPFIIFGFFLLFKGGDFLVTGAAGIAQKKNIPAFIVGITLVAFGTRVMPTMKAGMFFF